MSVTIEKMSKEYLSTLSEKELVELLIKEIEGLYRDRFNTYICVCLGIVFSVLVLRFL